jgi:hypothetical protein
MKQFLLKLREKNYNPAKIATDLSDCSGEPNTDIVARGVHGAVADIVAWRTGRKPEVRKVLDRVWGKDVVDCLCQLTWF